MPCQDSETLFIHGGHAKECLYTDMGMHTRTSEHAEGLYALK